MKSTHNPLVHSRMRRASEGKNIPTGPRKLNHTVVWPDWLPPMTLEEWCAQPIPDLLTRRPFIQYDQSKSVPPFAFERGSGYLFPIQLPFIHLHDGTILWLADPQYLWPIPAHKPLDTVPMASVSPPHRTPASWWDSSNKENKEVILHDVPMFQLLAFIGKSGGVDMKRTFENYSFV